MSRDIEKSLDELHKFFEETPKEELNKIYTELEGFNSTDFFKHIKEYPIIKLSELGNHQVQDILEDMGMIDENGSCPYTAEEIFRAGMEYAIMASVNWLDNNVDLEHDYPNSKEELISDFKQAFE